jgi:riboflavin-specific deaminase-like protein
MERFLSDLRAAAPEHLERLGRPLVTLSYAQTIDGSLSVSRGRPSALSGPEARRFTHELRAAHAAILVGIGTVLSDDPLLSVRYASGPDPQPVVLDTTLRFPVGARLLRDHPLRAWIFTSPEAPDGHRRELEGRGAEVLTVPAETPGGLDLDAVLRTLAQRGIASLMVEGGAGVITSFLRHGLVDLVAITIAPLFAGGYAAVGALDATTVEALPRLVDTRMVSAGRDWVLFGSFGA